MYKSKGTKEKLQHARHKAIPLIGKERKHTTEDSDARDRGVIGMVFNVFYSQFAVLFICYDLL